MSKHIGPSILVCTNGFVFVGDATIHDDGSVTSTDTVNVRQYGTEGKGMAALAHGPLKATVVDFVGILNVRPHAFLMDVPLAGGAMANFLSRANRV